MYDIALHTLNEDRKAQRRSYEIDGLQHHLRRLRGHKAIHPAGITGDLPHDVLTIWIAELNGVYHYFFAALVQLADFVWHDILKLAVGEKVDDIRPDVEREYLQK